MKFNNARALHAHTEWARLKQLQREAAPKIVRALAHPGVTDEQIKQIREVCQQIEELQRAVQEAAAKHNIDLRINNQGELA